MRSRTLRLNFFLLVLNYKHNPRYPPIKPNRSGLRSTGQWFNNRRWWLRPHPTPIHRHLHRHSHHPTTTIPKPPNIIPTCSILRTTMEHHSPNKHRHRRLRIQPKIFRTTTSTLHARNHLHCYPNSHHRNYHHSPPRTLLLQIKNGDNHLIYNPKIQRPVTGKQKKKIKKKLTARPGINVVSTRHNKGGLNIPVAKVSSVQIYPLNTTK